MGRGDKERQQQYAAQSAEMGFLRGETERTRAERAEGRKLLMPEYQKIIGAPGYTPEQQASIRGANLESLGGVYDALQQSATNRLARTGNAAGYNDLLEELGRERGRQFSRSAREIEGGFAERALDDRFRGLAGVGGLYGLDTGLLSNLIGARGNILGTGAQLAASAPRGSGLLGSLIGAGGAIGSAAIVA